MGFPTNSNLPLSYVKPTVAVQIDTNAPAVANADEASTVLVWGEQLTSGLAPFNGVRPVNSLQDAITNYGKRSTVTRMMRAGLSQKGVTGAVRYFAVGVAEPSSGTSGTCQIVCSIPGTNPTSAAGATFYMGGTELASVSWTTADTATTIGESLEAALNALEYAPFGTWTNTTGSNVATFNLKGALAEDYPLRVEYTREGTGVFFGPGSVTFATAAVGAGSISLVVGATTISTALAGGESATVVGDKFVAQLATNDYPLVAGTNAAGVVPLYFRAGNDYRRASIAIVTTTGTTALLTNGVITDGTGSANSKTYAGTAGAGYPTLTTAVTNVRNAGSFGKHVAPWFDATTAGAIFAAIVVDGDGGPAHQKGQTLTICSTGTESAAETFLGATSPAMTSTTDNAGMRGAILICPDAPHPGYEQAMRVAGIRASVDSPFHNYDGERLTGTSDVPQLLPSMWAQSNLDDATQNTAIRAGLTPLAVQEGSLVIVFGRTTMSTTAKELWDWAWIDQADNHRLDLRAQARPTFAGAGLIPDSVQPKSRKDIQPRLIVAFLQTLLRRWQAQGTYVGAEQFKDQCLAQINPSQPSRADAVYPESPKVPLHSLGVVSQRVSPPTE